METPQEENFTRLSADPELRRVERGMRLSLQPSAVQLECAGYSWCPAGSVLQCDLCFLGRDPVLTRLPLMPLAFGNLCESSCCCSCSMCNLAGGTPCMCLKGFLLGHRASCFWWCHVLMLWGIALRRWYAKRVCMFCYFFLPSVSWKTRIPACVLSLCCTMFAAGNLHRTCITGRICDCGWGYMWNYVISLVLRIITTVLTASYFSPLYLYWLKQPNTQIFLENLGRRVEKIFKLITCQMNEMGNVLLSK